MANPSHKYWGLILGGSSGIGLASAKKLAREGMSICVVHRDLKGAMERVEKDFDEIRRWDHGFVSLNLDGLSNAGIAATMQTLSENGLAIGKIRVLLHSIAHGNLRPIVGSMVDDSSPVLEDEDMARTIYAMGTSLLTWVQQLHKHHLFSSDARVLGLTSQGNHTVWKGYAAVAAAKSALESVSRAIAVEFAPFGIRSNIIQAGVTDTRALQMVPGNEKLKAAAIVRNPFKRLTSPEDVANVVYLLSRDEAQWINGALIRVDGGECIGSS